MKLKSYIIKTVTLFVLLFIPFAAVLSSGEKTVNLNLEDGLPDNSVRVVLQDDMGFIWLGTNNGLYRYDGYEFRILETSLGEKSISDITVTDLKQDNRGRLWIASNEKGVLCYDLRNERFVNYANELTIRRSQVLSLEMVNDSVLLLGTVNGMIKVTSSGGNFNEGDRLNTETIYPEPVTQNPNNNYVTCIKYIEDGADSFCWIGTNARLYAYRLKDDSFTAYDSPRGAVRELARTVDGQTMVGYWNSGVEIYNDQGEKEESIRADQINSIVGEFRVISILSDQPEEFWIGTYQHGLYKFDFADGTMDMKQYIYSPSGGQSIGSNDIFSIIRDQLGIIWLGHSFGGGVTKLYSELSTLEVIRNIFPDGSEFDYTVTSITSTPSSTLWISTLGKGIACYVKKSGQRLHLSSTDASPYYIGTDNIQVLEFDPWGNIWLGTSGQGAVVIPFYVVQDIEEGRAVAEKSVYSIDRSIFPLINNYIYDILVDTSGNLWLATHQGLYHIRIAHPLDSEAAFMQFQSELEITDVFENDESLLKVKVNSLVQDENGDILACTDNSGIISIRTMDGGGFFCDVYKSIPFKEFTISSNETYTGCFDGKGAFWVATSNGLDRIHLNSRRVQRVLSTNDIGSFRMLNTTFDDSGQLWLAMNYGILRYDTLNKQIRKYFLTEAADNYFSTGAFHTDSDGRIYLGSRYNIVNFMPENVIDTSYFPPYYVTEFRINNTRIIPGTKVNGRKVTDRNINELTHLKLNNRDVNISFDLASLDFINSKAIQYRYKLIGSQNEEWVILNQGLRTISFSSLKPGLYRLIITCTNSFGEWNNDNKTITIRVLPHPLKSVPAIVAYFALLLLAVYYSQRIWLIRQKEKNAVLLANLQKEQSEELQNLKTQFFMNVSHEFRTPLSLIISPLEELKKKLQGPEEKYQLQLMTRNANRLLYLINQIINFRKVEKDKLNLSYKSVNISEFAQHIIQCFSMTADSKCIDLELISEDHTLEIHMDPFQMESVFYNFISNALRHTPEGGAIQIKIQRKEEQVVIVIRDSGEGIDPDQLPHIFERFYVSGHKGSGVGAGIGLSLTKSIIELHRGDIVVKSKKGKGTSFVVSMPLKAPDMKEKDVPRITVSDYTSQILAVVQQEYTEIEAKQIAEYRETVGEFLKDSKTGPGKRPHSIVVAEDNDELRTYLVSFLSDRFDRVEAVSNGSQALNLIREMKPDLVISDVMMPGIDGHELTRIIKDDESLNHIYIILITAKNYEEDRINAIQAGVDVYIFKPFRMEYLMLRIDKLFEQKELFDKQLSEGIFHKLKGEKIENSDKIFIDRAIAIVEENLADPDFRLEMLFRELNISRAQLYRKIGRLTGYSVKEFIREIRLQRAAQILKEDNLTINEVSYMVGFGSPTYFSICFKQKFGTSPVKYKAENYRNPRISI